mgnify:CR=1 FL=1
MNYLEKKKGILNKILNNYKNKNILIIGGLGFVGINLSNYLIDCNCKVSILSKRKLKKNENLNKKLKLIIKKNINISFLNSIFNNYDYIFNVAAVKKNNLFQEKYPADLFYLNSIINLKIIKSFTNSNAKKLIILSSSTAGQINSGNNINKFRANIGYAYSKKVAEIFALLSIKQYKKNITIIRSDNLFGEFDNFGQHSQVIPTIIKKFKSSINKVTLKGSGNETRNFLFINDFIRSLLSISVNKNSNNKIFEIKGSKKISIKKIATIIKSLMQSNKPIVFSDKIKKRILKKNKNEKNVEMITINNLNKIDDDLKKTIEWYLNNHKYVNNTN